MSLGGYYLPRLSLYLEEMNMAQLVDLKVGFSCNNNCIHCVVSDKFSEKDLTLSEIKALIDNYISEYGIIQLTLTGGEITIRKDFSDIMDFVHQRKNENKISFVDMQTNARMLHKDELAEIACRTVDFFLVALHSNQADVHDSITRAKGSFIQTTTALNNLINHAGKNKIAIQTVINKKNYTHLKNIYQYIYETFGIKECNITFPHPIGVCMSNAVVPSYKEVKPYVNEALDYCLENDIFPYIEALPFCVLNNGNNREYLFEFLKKRNIDVVGYCGEKDGNLNYSELFDEGHRKYRSCINCQYTGKCEGVWKEHVELYPDENMYALMKVEED